MGQAIVYCSNCSAQIRGADFEARKAFKVDDLIFCKKCCKEILGTEPPPPPSPSSSTKVKALPAPSSSRSASSTGHIRIIAPPRKGGSVGWIAAVMGVGAVVIVIAIASSGGNDRREPPPAPPSPNPPSAAAPASAPRVSAAETTAREALAKAARFAADHPQDLAGQRGHFAEAVARAAGTPLLEDARSGLDRVDRKLRDLRSAELANVEKPPTAPPPPLPPPPPVEPKPDPERPREDPARRARWEAALSPATGRDYPAALAALEKLGDAESSSDLPLLKSVASLHREALQALTRTPKGQKVAIDFRDGAGEPRRVEASFVAEEDGRVELRGDSGTVEIEAGEILPSSFADLLRSRGGAVDPAAAAVFCLLEGDPEGARRLLGDKAAAVPERFWIYARKSAADPARGLYQEAMALADSFATEADALPKLQALVRDHAESNFVRRNKASLAARARQCARDYLFLAADLKPSGTLKAAKSAKGNACWTSDADSDAARLKENFLELSYSVLAETPYKCWIYAGGCCQETFEFSVQGTEMTGPAGKGGKEREPVEPGPGAAAEVKPWFSTLKKTHASHLGPKQPTSWEWIPVPLPKYAKPGLQRLRVLTDQKGFSVAFACVTATRTGPPREIDMRELGKSRNDRPASAGVQGPKATVLYACLLDGTDRRLVGDVRDRALHGQTLFDSCFTGVEGNPVFTMPAQGELRITYFLKTVTPLVARLRIPRGDKTVPYDVAVAQPVIGRAVELRIPLSEFKPRYGGPWPAAAAGDPVPMVYFFGEDVNCGLRVDALSIVELRSEGAGKSAVDPSLKVVYSETFDAGLGRWTGGESVDGGSKGSKALSVPPKGTGVFGAWSVPVKDSTTLSFRIKALGDVGRVEVMVWSEALKDNGRYFVDGLKKGEWQEIRFKAVELRLGYARDGPSIDLLNNFKLFFQNTPADVRVLLDDFEIRQ